MKNFYFDICAIPIYLLILHTYYTRKMAKFHSFKMFYMMGILSLLCAILDIVMEFVVNPLPLTALEVTLGMIKIDKSMVDDIFTKDGGVIIKNTVRMMQGINKKLIMEGAETKETVDLLSSLSCEYIQGFYFSKPLPGDDFIKFLEQNNDPEKVKLYS